MKKEDIKKGDIILVVTHGNFTRSASPQVSRRRYVKVKDIMKDRHDIVLAGKGICITNRNDFSNPELSFCVRMFSRIKPGDYFEKLTDEEFAKVKEEVDFEMKRIDL